MPERRVNECKDLIATGQGCRRARSEVPKAAQVAHLRLFADQVATTSGLPRRHMVITGQPTCDHAGVLRESVLHSPASLGISVQGTPGQPIDAVKVSEIGPGLKRLRSGIGILPKSYFLQRLTTACNQLQNSRAGDLRDWLAHAGVLLIGRRRPSAIGHTQPLTA